MQKRLHLNFMVCVENIEKARILANAFISNQFNYVPLMWIFASKTAINKILKIHCRTLEVVYSEYHKS